VNIQDYTSKSIDHPGLVSALCQELRIAEFIDKQFPNQSEHRHISYRQLLVSMILNGLGFVSRTLHMYPAYFADKSVERLIGVGIKPDHIERWGSGTVRMAEELHAADLGFTAYPAQTGNDILTSLKPRD
jgi:transposase